MKFLRFLLVASLFALAACNDAGDPSNVGKPTACAILDYQNGVYYFNCTEAHFGNALSQFIGSHKDLELVTVSSDDTQSRGQNCGYFVIFRELHR